MHSLLGFSRVSGDCLEVDLLPQAREARAAGQFRNSACYVLSSEREKEEHPLWFR